MEEIVKLLEKYGYQFHKTYTDEGDGEIKSYYDKKWGDKDGIFTPANYMVFLTENTLEIFNCPEEQGFLKCLTFVDLKNAKYLDKNLKRIEKNLKKYN